MPTTYKLIASNTLLVDTTSVSFSSIPASYTDLVLKISARTTEAVSDSSFNITFNGITTNTYSRLRLTGNGATVSSSLNSSTNQIDTTASATGTSATASTFSNVEVYIPSYAVSQNKPVGIFVAHETNAATAYLVLQASLWRNTAAIDTITLGGIPASAKFATGSSFWLYGIKNS